MGFVIGSDRNATDAPTKRPPKVRPTDSFAVWTGEAWSDVTIEALTFGSLEDADEYVRANFSKVTGQPALTKPSGTRIRRQPSPSEAASSAAVVGKANAENVKPL